MFFSKSIKKPKVTQTIGNKQKGKTIEYFKASLAKQPKPAKKGMKVIKGMDLK